MTPMDVRTDAKNKLRDQNFSCVTGISRFFESDWFRQTYVCLTITKQKHLINSLAIRDSRHMIMAKYIFNIACFMTIEFSKVLQSDCLRKLLGTRENSEKSKIFPTQLFTARQKNREMGLHKQKTNISQNHHVF